MGNPISCPCELACKGRREAAVNLVQKEGMCTTARLKSLLEGSCGNYTIVKSIKFLTSGDCRCIEAFKATNEQKPTIFGRQGKLLFLKNKPEKEVKNKMGSLLTQFQKRLLEKFLSLNKDVFYFSLYDLKRLVPAPGNVVEYTTRRLEKLGFIEKVHLGNTDFYVPKSHAWKMGLDEQSIIVKDLAEFSVLKIVHELIMNLYPIDVMLSYDDAIRPRKRETLKITGGMTFDIFYHFRENTIEKKYLAIDVYTRFPVTGYTVNSFLKKIEWAKSREKDKITSYLAKNTYGMIVFRKATPAAIRKANASGIRFLRLSNLKIDYAKIVEQITVDYLKKFNENLTS